MADAVRGLRPPLSGYTRKPSKTRTNRRAFKCRPGKAEGNTKPQVRHRDCRCSNTTVSLLLFAAFFHAVVDGFTAFLLGAALLVPGPAVFLGGHGSAFLG